MARHQNDTISERRLRPIYDWLDNGNNKKALQEAEKVLKKQPAFQCCRALKSLALLRLGKEEEAMVILDEILQECPVDEGALNAMTLSYRELKMPDKICTLYENACKKETENEEFLSHLFMSYVRLGNLKKQQSTAINLYKVKMKNPYYFWSVMSIVLQAVEGDEKMGQAVSLPLAQKMVEKMEKDGKMEQEQETIIYLMILELRNNWKGALELLNGPLGKKLENSASYHLICLNKRIEIEGKLENWSEVARLSRNVLLQQPDSWDMFNNYIQAVLMLQKEKTEATNGEGEEMYSLMLNKIDRSVEEAESLMECLSAGFPGLRGPCLAKLEICYRTLEGRNSDLQQLLMEYIDLFGGKPVCFSDIKKYLKVIPVDERNDFILRLRSRYPDQVPSSTAEIYRDICITGIERYLGEHINLSTERVDSMVSTLYDRYLATQPLVHHIVSTELRPSDGYLVLAAQLLWERWITTKHKRFFLEGCAKLQLGILTSPSNWQLMLLLMRFVGRAGAGSLCDEVHTPLDVKNLMLDTLGWVVTRPLASAGEVDRVHRIYCQMSRFYVHAPKETTEHIIQAYKHGNLSQICDISKLKRRLTTSYTVPGVNTEKILIDINFLSNTIEDVSEHVKFAATSDPAWHSLIDNRDFRTIQSYEPDNIAVSEEIIKCNFNLELTFIKMRHYILQTVVTSLKPALIETKTSYSDVIKRLAELEGHLSNLLTESQTLVSNEIFIDLPGSPYKSQFNTLLPSKQVLVILAFNKIIQQVMQATLDEKNCVSSSDFQQLLQLLDEVNKDIGPGNSPEDWTEISVTLELNQFRIETFCLATLCTFAILSLLRGGKGMKKGKKPVLATKWSFLEQDYRALTSRLEILSTMLNQQINGIYKNLSDEMLTQDVENLSLSDYVEQNYGITQQQLKLTDKICQSYNSQKEQMLTAISNKTKILHSIKL